MPENIRITSAVQIVSRYGHMNWALADQMIVSGTNFFTGILLARHLGVKQYGQFSLAWMVILFVQSMQQAMIHSPMMSIGPKQAVEGLRSYNAIVVFHQIAYALFSTTVVIAGLLLSGQLFPEWGLSSLIWPLGSVVLVSQTQEFLRRYFFTIGRPWVSFAGDTLRYGGQIAALLWLFLVSSWRPEISEALWAIMLTACAGTFAGIININNLEWPKGGWLEISCRHWHFSKWLIGTNILTWASGNIFYIATGAIIGASAVGILMAAQSVMAVTHIFILGLQNFLPIRASKVYREGGAVQLTKFVYKAALSVTLATVVIALLVCIFPGRIMDLLYGSAFQDYGWVLVGYAFIYVLLALGTVFPIGLLAMEKTFPILLSYVCSGFVSISCVYPLVKGLGMMGVLFGLMTSAGIQFLVLYLAFRRLTSLNRSGFFGGRLV